MMGRARCGRGEHNDGDRDHCISGRFLRMEAAREIFFLVPIHGLFVWLVADGGC
jgi:hypothetical protein